LNTAGNAMVMGANGGTTGFGRDNDIINKTAGLIHRRRTQLEDFAKLASNDSAVAWNWCREMISLKQYVY